MLQKMLQTLTVKTFYSGFLPASSPRPFEAFSSSFFFLIILFILFLAVLGLFAALGFLGAASRGYSSYSVQASRWLSQSAGSRHKDFGRCGTRAQ